MRLRPVLLAFAVVLLVAAVSASAQPRYQVVVTNITANQIISPPVLVTHNARADLFQVGQPVSGELAAVAEDADTSGLVAALGSDPGVYQVVVAAGGPLLPGASATIEIDSPSGGFNRLSAVGMLVTTNDAFFGLDSYRLAGGPATRDVEVPAYDAGSEFNSESCDFIPGPPCGNGGVRDTAGAEGFVHVHAGIQGTGDLMPAEWDWLNPVVHIRIIRQ